MSLPPPPEAVALPDTTIPWALRVAPRRLRGYVQLARLDRPIGWQLLLAPCWWADALAALAAGTPPRLSHLALFTLGAIAMRGAGSTLNDIADRDIDRRVARTRERPVASGRVSRRAAAVFLALQALVGLAVLLAFNGFTVGLSIASLAIVAVYPFAKRVTSWPQAVLGLAFAWGALVGWAAVFGALALPALLLYAGTVAWTIGYDTIYALQDRDDDAIVGIGSTALLFGAHVRPAVAGFYGAAALLVAGSVATAGGSPAACPLAWAGAVGFAVHLAWQVARIEPAVPGRSQDLFRSNRVAGLVLFAGLAGAAVLRATGG